MVTFEIKLNAYTNRSKINTSKIKVWMFLQKHMDEQEHGLFEKKESSA